MITLLPLTLMFLVDSLGGGTRLNFPFHVFTSTFLESSGHFLHWPSRGHSQSAFTAKKGANLIVARSPKRRQE